MIYIRLFLTFLKIGAFTFGGGYAMLPLIQEAVIGNNWMDSSKIVNFIAVSESTPGPFAINIATYIGSETGKTGGGFVGILTSLFGAFCATLGVVLPSFVIILIVAKCYERFKNSGVVIGCMSGLKPAVVGLIGAAVLSVFKTVLLPDGFVFSAFKDAKIYVSLVIFAIAAFLTFKKKVHPIIIILIASVLGILCGYLFGI